MSSDFSNSDQGLVPQQFWCDGDVRDPPVSKGQRRLEIADCCQGLNTCVMRLGVIVVEIYRQSRSATEEKTRKQFRGSQRKKYYVH